MKIDTAHDQALVEQTLAHGFWALRFPPALEQAFVLAQAEDRTFKLIVAGLSSILIFAAILLADHMMLPSDLPKMAFWRVGVYAPLMLLGLVVFHRLSLPALNEWMVALVVLLASTIVAYLATHMLGRLGYVKVVELVLVVTFVGVFARFWPMMLMAVIVAVMHVYVLAVTDDVVGTVRLSASLLLGTTLIFALMACYRHEHNERLSFLLDLRERALQASLCVANARLDALAHTDALTGVANRRSFDEFLQSCWTRACGEGHSLAMLLIDVDHFKRYNDHYGHLAGDRCLQMVAQEAGACLRRPVDLLARWGGEEFAVVLSDADLAAATYVAQRIGQAVQARGVRHEGAPDAGVLTVSIGVAAMRPQEGDAPETLLQRADEALYRAKQRGRNQVCVDAALPMRAVESAS